MWWQFRLNLSQNRKFWQARRILRNSRFLLKRQEFRIEQNLHSAANSQRIFWGLIRITYFSFFLSLGVAAVLLATDLYVPVPKNAGLSPIPLWHIETNDSYSSLLSTISGIGGVLIALYYSGMVAAGSAVYAKVPAVLRSLLLREPIGKFFIQLVAFTTFLALCLLSFSAMGFSPIRFAFPVLILLSGTTVLSFVHLGQQAFNLFDPTRLAGAVFEDLESSVKRVMVPARFWNDPSFQWHAHRQAASALQTLDSLTAYAIADEHLKAGAVADVATSTVNFLYRYETSKRKIPTKSKWYSTQFRHVDFYVADAYKADIAIRSGGSVQPEVSQDEHWVEKLAYEVVLQSLTSNLRESSVAEAVRILENLRTYSEHLGRSWEVNAAVDLNLRVADAIFLAVLSKGPHHLDGALMIEDWHAAVLEYLALIPIATLLGFIESVRQTSPEKLDSELKKIRWGKAEYSYRFHFETFALSKIEWFSDRITFELDVEGRRTTPDWFLLQLASRDYLEALQSCTKALFRISNNGFRNWALQFEQAGNPWGRAILLNRHEEYLSKLSAHLHWIKSLEVEFEKVKVLPDLIGWPKPKTESFSTDLSASRVVQNQAVASMALELSKIARPESLPDFGGQFLARTANHIVESLFDKGAKDFQELFLTYWHASLAKFSSLFTDSGSVDQDGFQRFAQSAAPLLDLLEISGFAILVSELKETPAPWEALQQTWDRYFGDPKAGETRVGVIDTALRLTEMPMIASGDMPRHQWRIAADDWLRNALGIESSFTSPWARSSRHNIHSRPLIRVLARDAFPGMRRGSDIFGAMYFAKFLGEQKEVGGIRFHDLANSIRLEVRNANKEHSESEDIDETFPGF